MGGRDFVYITLGRSQGAWTYTDVRSTQAEKPPLGREKSK